ncbi:MAG: hypothetical protein ACYTGF_15705, partial [Planctomycetota bacterium]
MIDQPLFGLISVRVDLVLPAPRAVPALGFEEEPQVEITHARLIAVGIQVDPGHAAGGKRWAAPGRDAAGQQVLVVD